MELRDAEKLALELMKKHGIGSWAFQFDKAVRRFGSCSHKLKQITLSRQLVLLNDSKQVEDTILHEIAHALVPNEHHGRLWQRTARAIGCNGHRCYSKEVTKPKPRYKVVCKCCGKESTSYRKHNATACGHCCNLHNKGLYDSAYNLTYIKI